MAYRVTSDAANGSRIGARRRGDGALTRNATIAGVTLASLSLLAAGAALFGHDRDVGSVPRYVASHSALKLALVDAAPPPSAPAPVKIAARIEPGADAPQDDAAPVERLRNSDIVPLPQARPVIKVAAIPLPRARAADTEPTGSLGTPPREVAMVQLPALALAPMPLTHEPAAILAIAPAKPAHEAARTAAKIPAKPRQLTPHDKLYGPVRLASLTPSDGIRDDSSGMPRAPYDRQTAVYVITDKTVYLPDGRTLEAHSGLGDKLDDPRFVNLRMRGATPPHVYDLTMRESLFHGVEALRMTPIGGENAIFGRDGILAHTYMLGPNGQSNGCVSVKDYDAFLDAFKAGKISRLAVIARLD